jgi:predicted secreted protein
MMVNEFKNNGYQIAAFIGIENSPTCSVLWGKHKVNRYGTESPNSVDDKKNKENKVMGIVTEIINEKLRLNGIEMPFLEFPLVIQADSYEKINFWNELKTAVEEK